MGDSLNNHEEAASTDVWSLISTALGIPEGTDNPQDYWDDVMHGTCLLLGAVYKLARELKSNHRGCGTEMPVATQRLVDLVLVHEVEIKQAWLQALES